MAGVLVVGVLMAYFVMKGVGAYKAHKINKSLDIGQVNWVNGPEEQERL